MSILSRIVRLLRAKSTAKRPEPVRSPLDLNFSYFTDESSSSRSSKGSSLIKDVKQKNDKPDHVGSRLNLAAVTAQEWQIAHQVAEQKKSRGEQSFKITRKETKLPHSFLYKKGKLYCMAGESKLLGKGSQGKVKMAMTQEGKLYAVKIQTKIKNSDSMDKSNESEGEEREINRALNRYEGRISRETIDRSEAGKIAKKEWIIQSYLGEDLNKLLERNTLNKKQKYEIGHKLLEQVNELHEKHRIIHCDLHAGMVHDGKEIGGNILVRNTENGFEVAVIDFGLSKKLAANQDKIEPAQGEPLNSAILPPDFICENGRGGWEFGANPFYSKQTDIYALGLILKNKLKITHPIIDRMLDLNAEKRPALSEAMKSLDQRVKTLARKAEVSSLLRKAQDLTSSFESTTDGYLKGSDVRANPAKNRAQPPSVYLNSFETGKHKSPEQTKNKEVASDKAEGHLNKRSKLK